MQTDGSSGRKNFPFFSLLYLTACLFPSLFLPGTPGSIAKASRWSHKELYYYTTPLLGSTHTKEYQKTELLLLVLYVHDRIPLSAIRSALSP